MTGKLLAFDPLAPELARRIREAEQALERAAELGELTPALAEALEQFAAVFELAKREQDRRLDVAEPAEPKSEAPVTAKRTPNNRFAAFVGYGPNRIRRRRAGED